MARRRVSVEHLCTGDEIEDKANGRTVFVRTVEPSVTANGNAVVRAVTIKGIQEDDGGRALPYSRVYASGETVITD